MGKKAIRTSLIEYETEEIVYLIEESKEITKPISKIKKSRKFFWILLGLFIPCILLNILINSNVTFQADVSKPIETPTKVITTPIPTPTIAPMPTPIVNKIIVGKGFWGWFDSVDPTNNTFTCPKEMCPNLLESHIYYVCATGSGINGDYRSGANETLYVIEGKTKKFFSQFPACVIGKYRSNNNKIGYLSQNLRMALFPFQQFPILYIEIYDQADGKPSYPIFNIAIKE